MINARPQAMVSDGIDKKLTGTIPFFLHLSS